ncbi:MAG: glutathione S-transferase N-terminal domain-containing protein [Comamonadaceae bacterium]|nr:glutathione S-transferase N-terminal domain-containing protein [Comamonadaceae bacterium]
MKLIGSLDQPLRAQGARRDGREEARLPARAGRRLGRRRDARQSNPLGKVPCLVMEGGEAVFDSRVIVEYLDTLSPVGKLIPPTGRERVEVRTWEALADGVLDAAILARLEATWSGRTRGAALAGLDRPPDEPRATARSRP